MPLSHTGRVCHRLFLPNKLPNNSDHKYDLARSVSSLAHLPMGEENLPANWHGIAQQWDWDWHLIGREANHRHTTHWCRLSGDGYICRGIWFRQYILITAMFARMITGTRLIYAVQLVTMSKCQCYSQVKWDTSIIHGQSKLMSLSFTNNLIVVNLQPASVMGGVTASCTRKAHN